jgi:hypothetical protein
MEAAAPAADAVAAAAVADGLPPGENVPPLPPIPAGTWCGGTLNDSHARGASMSHMHKVRRWSNKHAARKDLTCTWERWLLTSTWESGESMHVGALATHRHVGVW